MLTCYKGDQAYQKLCGYAQHSKKVAIALNTMIRDSIVMWENSDAKAMLLKFEPLSIGTKSTKYFSMIPLLNDHILMLSIGKEYYVDNVSVWHSDNGMVFSEESEGAMPYNSIW